MTTPWIHPTDRGLALRAVDVAAGRVPNVPNVALQGPHPDSEKPLGYDEAIDPATGLNWMHTPVVDTLSGTGPLYVLVVAPWPASARGAYNYEALKKAGYRPGESYWMPSGWNVVPPVWDATNDRPPVVGELEETPTTELAPVVDSPDEGRPLTDSLPTPAPFVPRVGDRAMFPDEGGAHREFEVQAVRRTIRAWGGDSLYVTADPVDALRRWYDATHLDYIPREADHA